MKFLINLVINFYIVSCIYAQYKLPSSDDPEAFHQEVKNYVLLISENGINIDRGSAIVREKIARDTRDWETPLSDIIGNVDLYDMGPAEAAILAAIIRKKGGDPRIKDAAIKRFERTIPISIDRVTSRSDDQVLVSGSKGWVDTLILEITQLESPDTLQAILEYLHSPEVDKLDTLQMYAPKNVAPALQKYGDLRNAEEAVKVAKKLESIGRIDVAMDIRRAAEGIKKDSAQKQITSTLGPNRESNDASETGAQGEEPSNGRTLWPWLAAGAALVTALAAYFRMKRTES